MEILGCAHPALIDITTAFKDRFQKIEIGDETYFKRGMGDNQIYLTQKLDPIELTNRLIAHRYKNIIQKNEDSYLADVEIAANLIENSESYFSSGGKGVISQAKQSKLFLADTTTNKGEFFRNIAEFFEKEEISENSKISAITILGEFYNNAMIDAPEEFAKVHSEQSIPKEKRRVSINIEMNEDRMSISCMDLFGMLRPYNFIERLNTVLKSDIQSAINYNHKKRAGIGCHLILENCDFLIIGTRKNEKTIFTALLPIHMSNKNRALRSKSIQIINQ